MVGPSNGVPKSRASRDALSSSTTDPSCSSCAAYCRMETTGREGCRAGSTAWLDQTHEDQSRRPVVGRAGLLMSDTPSKTPTPTKFSRRAQLGNIPPCQLHFRCSLSTRPPILLGLTVEVVEWNGGSRGWKSNAPMHCSGPCSCNGTSRQVTGDRSRSSTNRAPEEMLGRGSVSRTWHDCGHVRRSKKTVMSAGNLSGLTQILRLMVPQNQQQPTPQPRRNQI